MSEYQYVAFLAIDRPVSEKEMPYMRRQSSRAEITPWKFENEYHFGDFGGNAVEMLRRGYDAHLHYANFGIRKLLLRFPQGLPNFELCKEYCDGDSLRFAKDKTGPGLILAVEPWLESGELEDLWDLTKLLERIAPIRAEILEGDPRPFYLGRLAVACDANHDPDDTSEAPVPAGLKKLTKAQKALAEFYGIDEHLIAAAAEQSAPAPARQNSASDYLGWLQQQPSPAKDGWLNALMSDAGVSVRAEMLAAYRKDREPLAWPIARPNRTISELRSAAETIASSKRRARK